MHHFWPGNYPRTTLTPLKTTAAMKESGWSFDLSATCGATCFATLATNPIQRSSPMRSDGVSWKFQIWNSARVDSRQGLGHRLCCRTHATLNATRLLASEGRDVLDRNQLAVMQSFKLRVFHHHRLDRFLRSVPPPTERGTLMLPTDLYKRNLILG